MHACIHTGYIHTYYIYRKPTVPPNSQPHSVLGVRCRYAWVARRPGNAPSDRTPGLGYTPLLEWNRLQLWKEQKVSI